MNFYNPNMMPMSGCGCGGEQPSCCNNVVHECFVEEVPHVVNYHTHVIKNCVKKHITIPQYTQSEEVIYYDQYEPCGCGYGVPGYPTPMPITPVPTEPQSQVNSNNMPNNLFNQVNPFNF